MMKRLGAWFLCVSAFVLAEGCKSAADEEGTDFEVGMSECQVSSNSLELVDASGTALPTKYTGCRVRWSASARVLTWQLTTGGSQGSWMFPGASWINLSLHGDSPESSTLRIASTISELPMSVAQNEVVLTIAGKTGGRGGARGSVAVGSNTVYTRGGGAILDATFDNVQLVGAGDAVQLRGAISMAAQAGGSEPGVATGGGPDGDPSGGGSCDQSACQGYTNTCANTVSQAPCYCAAACLCACAKDASCEAANRKSAAQLGTTCSY